MDSQGADQATGMAMPSYGQLFRVRAYVAIFFSSALSAWGDHLARLTVAAFVLQRSGSPLAAATTLAVSLIPSLFGRSLLGPIADRFPVPERADRGQRRSGPRWSASSSSPSPGGGRWRGC